MRCFAFPFVPRRSCRAGRGRRGRHYGGALRVAPRHAAMVLGLRVWNQPASLSARSRQGRSPTQRAPPAATGARQQQWPRPQATPPPARQLPLPCLPGRGASAMGRDRSRREATTGANGTPHPNPERKVGLGRWSTSVCRGTLAPGSVCFPALQVRSGWGGAGRSGVDSDLLQLQPVARDLDGAKTNSSSPLRSDPQIQLWRSSSQYCS